MSKVAITALKATTQVTSLKHIKEKPFLTTIHYSLLGISCFSWDVSLFIICCHFVLLLDGDRGLPFFVSDIYFTFQGHCQGNRNLISHPSNKQINLAELKTQLTDFWSAMNELVELRKTSRTWHMAK